VFDISEELIAYFFRVRKQRKLPADRASQIPLCFLVGIILKYENVSTSETSVKLYHIT
jgi:hypothetical protein